MSAGIAVASGIPTVANAAAADPNGWQPVVERIVQPVEKLQLLFTKNKRTGEIFNDVVRQGALIFDDAYAEIDHLMRDWRRDEVIAMDRQLIDLLLTVQNEVGYAQPISVISGYRSKTTNEMLRRRMSKVAKNSYHIRGMAVDLRVKGVSPGALRQIAMHQKIGGVGFYPKSGFVHIDTGPVRSWTS